MGITTEERTVPNTAGNAVVQLPVTTLREPVEVIVEILTVLNPENLFSIPTAPVPVQSQTHKFRPFSHRSSVTDQLKRQKGDRKEYILPDNVMPVMVPVPDVRVIVQPELIIGFEEVKLPPLHNITP